MLKISSALFIATAGIATANPLTIVTDVLPLSGIVTAIGGHLVSVTSLVDRDQSPHHLSLKPSQARALEQADLIVISGPNLTPGLFDKVTSLASDTPIITAQDIAGTLVLEREDHRADHDDDHDDHGHNDHAYNDHDHGPIDPHLWLSPENGKIWADAVARQLSTLSPNDASFFAQNLIKFSEQVDAIQATSPQFPDTATIAFAHDAFQYALNGFGTPNKIVITDADDAQPSAKRVAEVHSMIATTLPVCFVLEPNESSALATQIGAKYDIPVVTISPLIGDEMGHQNDYLNLLATVSKSFAHCAQSKTH